MPKPSKPVDHSSKRNTIVAGVVLFAAALTIFAVFHRSRDDHKPGAATDIRHSFVKNSVAMNQTGKVEGVSADLTEDSAKLVTDGNDLLQRGNYDGAIDLFRKALQDDPDQEDVHFNLGIALAREGKKEQAKAEYLEALRIYPEYAEAHNNLGNLLMSEGNLPEAIEHFQAAIQASPEAASAHNNLGTAQARQGKLIEAIPQFSEAIRLQADYPDAHCNLGNAYLGENRVEEAVVEFKLALRTHPDFQPALKGLERARSKR